MNRIFCLLAILAFPMLMGLAHPFYVSVTELEYNSKTREIGIACRLFPDDLEETLRLFSKKKFDLSGSDKAKNEEVLNAYFSKHMQVEVNSKLMPMKLLGYEIEKESVWIYFNIQKVSGVKKISLNTDILYEYRSEQTNIVHLNLDGKRMSHRLNAPASKVSIEK